MDLSIQERYSDAILASAVARYRAQNIKPLDGFESYIYEFERDGQPYILRIGHSLRRSEALIRGEVDWINYLADGGAGVARAVLSEVGNLVEKIDDGQGGQFLATAFERAPGGSPFSQPDSWNAVLWEEYGRVIGRVHVLSKTYVPGDPAASRPQWDDPIMLETLDWLPESDHLIRAHWQDLYATLSRLPKDVDSYGMIHQDAHAGNFFVDENGRITLFDFDDCAVSWYVYDIAMVLFYAVTNHPEPESFAMQFLPVFLRGYAQENRLDHAWLAKIPAFMKMRELDLYAVITHTFSAGEYTDESWLGQFMHNRRARLTADVPYLALDFTQLAWLDEK